MCRKTEILNQTRTFSARLEKTLVSSNANEGDMEYKDSMNNL